jgi:hypothetical protein
MKIILTLLLLLIIPILAFADDFIYDKPYGGSAIGKTDNKDGAGYWLLKQGKK